MASLNTLRTKGGVIVSIVIGVSLIAFLLGDLTSPQKGIFGGKKMQVGEIAGDKIDYYDYAQESDYMTRITQLMSGNESLSNEQADQVREMAWEAMILKHSFLPGFEAMGIAAGDAEQIDMTSGVYLSPVIQGTFVNRSTGMYDPEMLRQFIANRDNDPSGNSSMLWDYLKEQMVNQRLMSKYISLVTNSFTVNQVEIEQGVKDANSLTSGRYISLPYNTIADSLVKVTDSQVKKYYNEHKQAFKQGESRTVRYVVFDMLPSDEDYAAAEARVAELATEFAAADEPMQYAQANSQQNPDTRFVRVENLETGIAALVSGAAKFYGPTLRGDVYTMARLAATKMAPDTIGAKHILLQPTDTALADSLLSVIRKGGDFASLAGEFSLDKNAAGGDLGRFAPEQMIAEFSDACLKAAKGDIFTVNTQFGLHVVQLTYKSAPVLKAQIATVIHTVEPSQKTEQEIYGQASNFAVAAAGSAEKFDAAVSAEGLSARTARIRNTERNVQGLDNSRELVHWAYTAKKGAVSTIMEVGGGYVIASLAEVRHQGIASVQEVSSDIRQILIREEKGKMLAEKLSAAGSSLDQAAQTLALEPQTVTDLQTGAFFIDGAGVEQKLIGAFCATPAGQTGKPVQGMSGVFLFEVTNVATADNATPESEKVRLEAAAQAYIAERVAQALGEESKITDTRVKFF